MAVDVGVEHPDLLAACGESRGEVRGQRRLADTALAGCDREDTRRRVESEIVFSGRPPRSRVESAAFSSALMTSKWSSTEVTPSTLADESLHLVLERRAHRAACDGERDGDLHTAVVVDHDVAHHVELGDRLVQLGVDHVLERLQDRVALGKHRGVSLPTAQ